MTRLQYLRRVIGDATTALEDAQAREHRARQMVGRSRAAGIEPDQWIAEYREAKNDEEAAKARLDRAYAAIASLVPGGGGSNGGGGQVPPPTSSGKTVDPVELRASLMTSLRGAADVPTEWGASVVWPSMRDEHLTVTKGNCVLIHPGVGPDGVLATRMAPHSAELLDLDGAGRARWLAMTYGMADVDWHDIHAHDLPEEHAWYDKSCWSKSMTGWLVEEVGSQAFQDVSRVHEMLNPLDIYDPNGDGAPSEVLVDQCAFLEVGKPTGARPGYTGSWFESQGIPGTGIINRNVTIRGSHFEQHKYANFQASGGLAYSFGAIMVHGHRRVAILDTKVLHAMPDRAVVQVWGFDELLVVGGEIKDHWYGRRLEVDVRGRPGSRITFQDVAGDWVCSVYKPNAPWYVFASQAAQYLQHQYVNESFDVTLS